MAVPSARAGSDPVSLAELHIVHDGRGHFLAYQDKRGGPNSAKTLRSALYMGDGKVFYKVRVAYQSDGDYFAMIFSDYRFVAAKQKSRLPPRRQMFEVAGDRFFIRCGQSSLGFSPVDERTRARIASKGKLMNYRRGRAPHRLARDDRGTYYYVDGHYDEERPYDKRLYIGRRGKMKRVPLLDVAIDRAGELYVAKHGSLRFDMRPTPRASWIPVAKGKPTELVDIETSLDQTRAFVYTELGIYLGKPAGTPCDWL